jgi:hypothetical protein
VSDFDKYLNAIGKSRDTATDLDEIQWLRSERKRLRLTDAEREAIEYAAVVGRVASELDREVLKGLLQRNGSPDGCETVQ